mgnify:CR=1 FL=1
MPIVITGKKRKGRRTRPPAEEAPRTVYVTKEVPVVKEVAVPPSKEMILELLMWFANCRRTVNSQRFSLRSCNLKVDFEICGPDSLVAGYKLNDGEWIRVPSVDPVDLLGAFDWLFGVTPQANEVAKIVAAEIASIDV